jgi:hypothetical protein
MTESSVTAWFLAAGMLLRKPEQNVRVTRGVIGVLAVGHEQRRPADQLT